MDPKRPLFPIYDIMEHWAAFAHSNPDVKCQHHALYLALVNLCKVKGGSSRFALAYQHGMDISGIGSRNTYAAVLKELQAWGFVTHTPGANGYKTPIIDVHFCASAEHQLSIYRASTSTPTDTSTGHNKEVISLRVEVVDVKAAAAKLESEKAALQTEVTNLKAQLAEKPAAAPEGLKAKSKAAIIAGQVASDGGATFTADNWPGLNDADTFNAILKDLGYVGINAERYRLDIRATVRANDMDVPAPTLRKFIKTYLNRESANAPLLPAPVMARIIPPMPDDPCSLWGAPNPDYDHRNYDQPAGQYAGTIQ